MITRQLQHTEIRKINVDRAVVIEKIENYFEDEVFLSRVAEKRQFAPGELDDIKVYLGVDDTHVVITTLKDLWTQKSIDDYRVKKTPKDI